MGYRDIYKESNEQAEERFLLVMERIAEIAEEYEGKAKIGKVNVDEEPELAAKFGIASIPTVMVFQDGEATDTSVGYRQKAEIAAMLKGRD